MSSNDWQICKLGDISTKITKGTTPTTLGFPFIESGINFIKAEALTFEGTIDSSKFVFISNEANEKLKRSIIEEGDILFSMAGMVLGKSAVVKKEHLPANTNQALAIIRLKKQNAIPQFVDYFMRQKSFFNYVNSSTGQSAQPNINLEEIGNLIINLPSLETQNKITSILSSIDEKINNNLATNLTLEEIARTIFKEWFVNFNYPNADGSRKHSEFGEIPSDWDALGIGEVCYVQNGYAFKSNDFKEDGEVGIIKIKNINGNVVDIEKTDFVDATVVERLDKKFKIESGSLLIAMTGAEVGKIGLVPLTEKNLWLNQRVGMFKEKIAYGNLFMYLLLSSDTYQTNIQNSALGSAQPNISASAIESIRAIIPTAELIEAFGKIVNPMFEKILDNLAENETLKITRDSLLPKLMSGEIDVNISNA